MVEHEYRRTLFDRQGADAASTLRAWAFGLFVFGVVVGGLLLSGVTSWWVFFIAAAAGLVATGAGSFLSTIAGQTVKHVMVSGATTPYTQQYSYQQSLVMRGEIDLALQSFEDVIKSEPRAVTPRVKAAELYIKEKKNYGRASEIFREIQRIPSVSAGDYVFATNRLVDMLAGPLNEPGRARVELRKLIDTIPDSPAAANAKMALAELRRREQTDDF